MIENNITTTTTNNNNENYKEYIIFKNKLANLICKTNNRSSIDLDSSLNNVCFNKKSCENNSIIDIPLPTEKDNFSEYSLFVDKIFKKSYYLFKNIDFI